MQGVHLRKYGVEAKIDFELYEVDGVDFRTDWTPAEGDVFMMRDEAAEEQVTNAAGNADLSTLVTDEGRGYSITLAAEDMQSARVVVYLVDQATKVFLDKALVIETYGHASAQHAFDLDDSVRGGMTALPNANADAAGGLLISDAGGLDMDAASGITLSGTSTGDSTLTTIVLTGGVAINGYYDGQLVKINSGTGAGQVRTILSYLAAGTVATVTRDWSTTPDATSKFSVLAADYPAILEAGTAQAGGASTITLDANASAINNTYNNNLIMITAGTGIGQTRSIGSYVGETKAATIIPAWTTQPDATSVYQIIPMGRVDVGGWLGIPVTASPGNLPDVNVAEISDDATAANNLEIDYDGTGYAKANSTIGTCTANTDMRGTNNAALASVLGALADAAAAGEVTEADTIMQYLKQLINILIGEAGIVAFPAEAAPANAVSLAEVIRAIHADVTGLNGDVMRGTDGANTTVPDAAGTAAGLHATTNAAIAVIIEYIDTEIAAILAAVDTEIATIKDAIENGTYGLSAIRTRGDAAWITGAGGDATLANQIAIKAILDTIDGLVEDSDGDRFTAKALEEAPSGGGASAEEVKTALEANGSKLDHLWEMTEDDAGTRRLTDNALEQAPSGAGLTETQNAALILVRDIIEGDAKIDTSVTPWQLVITKKGTDTEVVKKNLKDIAGVNLTAITTVIGQQLEP